MRRFAFTLLSLVAMPAMAQDGPSQTLVRRIDDDVRTILNRTSTPGAAILVTKDGRVLYSHAYGFRVLDPRLPATVNTHYEIGSITKQFTAAAILQLQAAHKLDIDATVSTYLPDVPHAAEITLRQLLTHTSGLADYLEASSDEQAARNVTFQQLMHVIADKPLDFKPGSKAAYSSTGYIILGRIIEVTSHQTYRQYVHEHLLRPAGMTETFTVADEGSLPAMAEGYRHEDGKLVRGPTISDSYGWSAGNLVSTIGDLARWNAALIAGKIVSKPDYTAMMTAQTTTAGENSGYGLGFFIETADGQPRIGHTGSTFGFTSANFFYPGERLRIIALTNNADQPEAAEILANAIYDELFPELARASTNPAPGEDGAVTARATLAFKHLQEGTSDESTFSGSLNDKLKAGVGKHMAGQFGPYGVPTSFVFKGRRSDAGKQWSDYLIQFGPGSSLKFSVALDNETKIVSVGFNGF